MLGRTMNSKTCDTRDHTKKPNERSNVELSGGAVVRLSAGLGRNREADYNSPEIKPNATTNNMAATMRWMPGMVIFLR